MSVMKVAVTHIRTYHICLEIYQVIENPVKARSHDLIRRIRFLLVPKVESCENSENEPPTHGSVISKN